MIYFKKTYYQNELELEHMETAMRKVSSKRNTSLDIQSSSTDIKTDKFFLGFEGNKDLKFTRIRTSFEYFLPKLIISIPKQNNQNYYKIRLSAISTIVFVLLSFGLILNLFFLIIGRITIDKSATAIMLFGGYLLLVLLELRLTNSRINRAIKEKGVNLAN